MEMCDWCLLWFQNTFCLAFITLQQKPATIHMSMICRILFEATWFLCWKSRNDDAQQSTSVRRSKVEFASFASLYIYEPNTTSASSPDSWGPTDSLFKAASV